MKPILVVAAGLAAGALLVLAFTQPWNRRPKAPPKAGQRAPGVDRIAAARADIEAGRLREACVLLDAELAENPLSAIAYALRARVDLLTGDLIGGQRRLANAASIDPDLEEISLLQGHYFMVQRDFRGATRAYGEALKRRAGNPDALAGRATARYELKEFAGAVEDATAALAAGSRDSQALFTRAASYGEMGQWNEALRDWTAYLAKWPKDAQAWQNRGNVHERIGQRDAALTDWEQASKLEAEGKRNPSPRDQ